jgi:hypothetical protein
VRGVGPAESTGKSRVSYCPGGSRPAVGAACRRPRNPLEMNGSVMLSAFSRLNFVDIEAMYAFGDLVERVLDGEVAGR